MKSYIVDAFTNKKFEGNPAAVCLLDKKITAFQMQKIAQEFNLSETAFVGKTDKQDTFSIRYFSPKQEIPLCGHATLASSKVIFSCTPLQAITFINKNGLHLHITKKEEQIEMIFPIYNLSPKDAPTNLLKAIGLKDIIASFHNIETNILMIEIEDAETLINLTPNFVEMVKVYQGIEGVLVTAKSKGDNYDFYSRYFWPWAGSNEDPVTGATHTFLAKYWGKKLNKTKMKSYQCSKRTGFMDLEIINYNKLIIKADAIIVFEGTFIL